MKHLLTFLLSAFLAFGVFPLSPMQAQAQCEDWGNPSCRATSRCQAHQSAAECCVAQGGGYACRGGHIPNIVVRAPYLYSGASWYIKHRLKQMSRNDIQVFAYANWLDIQSAHLRAGATPPSTGSIAVAQDTAKEWLKGQAKVDDFKKWYNEFQGSPTCDEIITYAKATGLFAFAVAGHQPGTPWGNAGVVVGLVSGATVIYMEHHVCT